MVERDQFVAEIREANNTKMELERLRKYLSEGEAVKSVGDNTRVS